jgi:hypothetical protein
LILSKKTFCKSIVESSFLDEAKIKTTGKWENLFSINDAALTTKYIDSKKVKNSQNVKNLF